MKHMASEMTLNAKNLSSLGAERLAELCIELATGDAGAKRRLRIELADAVAAVMSQQRLANGSLQSLYSMPDLHDHVRKRRKAGQSRKKI